MTRSFLLSGAITLALPFAALAVGNEEDVPPLPTQTTTRCAEGSVWDSAAQLCVAIEDTGLVTDPEMLIPTVRELAYAGRHADALALLARAPDQGDSMVLTYMGYSTRALATWRAAWPIMIALWPRMPTISCCAPTWAWRG
jgi:hypothetical protein